MRTLSIVSTLVSLTVLSSAANAGMPMGNGSMLNGLSTNGTQLCNGMKTNGSLVNMNNMQVLDAVLPNPHTASVHLRKVVMSTTDIVLYGKVLSQRSGERYRQ
jgi:hypothetical protein